MRLYYCYSIRWWWIGAIKYDFKSQNRAAKENARRLRIHSIAQFILVLSMCLCMFCNFISSRSFFESRRSIIDCKASWCVHCSYISMCTCILWNAEYIMWNVLMCMCTVCFWCLNFKCLSFYVDFSYFRCNLFHILSISLSFSLSLFISIWRMAPGTWTR